MAAGGGGGGRPESAQSRRVHSSSCRSAIHEPHPPRGDSRSDWRPDRVREGLTGAAAAASRRWSV